MKGYIIFLLCVVIACSICDGKEAKPRKRRTAEVVESLQLNNDLIRTKRKFDDKTLFRVKRLNEPEPELMRIKRMKRSLLTVGGLSHERSLKRMKRIPTDKKSHQSIKKQKKKKTIKSHTPHHSKRIRTKRINRRRRDIRKPLLPRRQPNTLHIPIMKRGHGHRYAKRLRDEKSQDRLNRMKAAIGKHIQQQKRNHFVHHKANGVSNKDHDVKHKRPFNKKNNVHNRSNKDHSGKNSRIKKHHVQGHGKE